MENDPREKVQALAKKLNFYSQGTRNQVMYFSSPTYKIDGVTAGNSVNDCRRAHVTYKDAISRVGNEAGFCDNGESKLTFDL